MPRLHFLALTAVLCSLVAQSSIAQPDKASMESRIAQARNLQEKGSTPAAKQLYQSLLPALRSSSLLPELALVQNALSQIAAGEGDYDSAIGSAREAAQIYHQIGDLDGEVLALNN